MIRTTFDDPARDLAVVLLLLLVLQPLLVGVQSVARTARRRAAARLPRVTPRHSLRSGRVDVVLMCANLDDDLRVRYGGARAD